MASGISAAAQRAGVKGILLYRAACPPLLGVDRPFKGREGCANASVAAMAYLQAHPEISHIFLISRWTNYMMWDPYKHEGNPQVFTMRDSQTASLSLDENKRVFKRSLERTVAQLRSLGRQVVLVTSTPEARLNIPESAVRAMLFGYDVELRPSAADYTIRQAFVTSAFDENRDRYGLSFIRPQDDMCDAEYCAVFDRGIPIYVDDNHITRTYSLKLSYLFDPIFQAMAPGKELPPRDAHN